jgi:uncharacterized membrane protein YidH (DUF202 family)
MNAGRIIGLVLLAVGIVLLVVAINATQGTTEQFRQSFTGKYSGQTMWYMVGGIACIVGGAALALFGGRLSHTH